jgi:O-antigen ligase
VIVILIDLIVVLVLVSASVRGGVERALPYLVFFAVLLPQESRVELSGVCDLSSTRIAIATAAILFLFSRQKVKAKPLPLKGLICMHVTWVVISTAFSIVVTTSLKQALAQVIEYYLMYLLLVRTITNVRTVTRIAYALVVAMSICSVFGLLEIYAQWSVLSVFPSELQLTYGNGSTLYTEMFDRGIRARSTFPHPIHFGGALAMTIPFALYLSSISKGWRQALLNLSLFSMFGALFKTGSRGPWLAAALAIAILAILGERKVRNRVMVIALLGCTVLLLRPGIADTLASMYNATFDTHSMMGSSFEYRPVLLHTVTRMLNENPERAIVGYGLGSFREKGLILSVPGIDTHRWYTCDSTWILCAYETGYVGLILLASVLIKPGLMALHSWRRLKKTNRCFTVITFSSLCAVYIVMISVSMYGWGQNGYMLWTVIAITISYIRLTTVALRPKQQNGAIVPAVHERTEMASAYACANLQASRGSRVSFAH